MSLNRHKSYKDARRDQAQFWHLEGESSRWLKILRSVLKQSGLAAPKTAKPLREQ
jgi:hypothetical protein